MKIQSTLLTLALASFTALAADITGTWKAEFETQRGLQKYTFTLKQDGSTVTGKASAERDGEMRDAEFKDGKVEGDTVTFVELLKIQEREINITFTGKIAGDEIKFTRKVGDFGSSEATAKRDGSPRGQGGRRGFGGPIELKPDDKPAFPDAPEGFDQARDGITHGKLEMVEYDSKSVGN